VPADVHYNLSPFMRATKADYLSFAHELWPAPGSEDTKLGVLMEREVRHGASEVYARVQA
jgi:hypothetical protein